MACVRRLRFVLFRAFLLPFVNRLFLRSTHYTPEPSFSTTLYDKLYPATFHRILFLQRHRNASVVSSCHISFSFASCFSSSFEVLLTTRRPPGFFAARSFPFSLPYLPFAIVSGILPFFFFSANPSIFFDLFIKLS
jgi:hypothetical protein